MRAYAPGAIVQRIRFPAVPLATPLFTNCSSNTYGLIALEAGGCI